MKAAAKGLLLLAWLAVFAGCASLSPETDPPRVSLESLRALPGESGAPRFEIRLRIANPNKQALDIAGIAYDVEVQGHDLVSGVTNEVPVIEGYAEETVTLEAGLQLFEMLRLLASLGLEPTDALEYRFKAKVDFNGFVPTQRIEERGSLTLR